MEYYLNSTLCDIRSSVQISVVDQQGSVVYTLEKSNMHTLWLDIFGENVSLYLDLTTVPFHEKLLATSEKWLYTAWDRWEELHSGLLGDPGVNFNREDKGSRVVYSASYIWENTSVAAVVIYGLVVAARKEDKYYLAALFDLTDNPAVVGPGTTVQGTYRVDVIKPRFNYNSALSLVSSSTSTHSVSRGVWLPGVSASIRDEIYSQYCVTAEMSLQACVNDGSVPDTVSCTITSSDLEKCAFSAEDMQLPVSGEVFYKCLQTGGPGTAKAVRYLRVVDVPTVYLPFKLTSQGLICLCCVRSDDSFYVSSGYKEPSSPFKCHINVVDVVLLRPDGSKVFASENPDLLANLVETDVYPVEVYFPDLSSHDTFKSNISQWKEETSAMTVPGKMLFNTLTHILNTAGYLSHSIAPFVPWYTGNYTSQYSQWQKRFSWSCATQSKYKFLVTIYDSSHVAREDERARIRIAFLCSHCALHHYDSSQYTVDPRIRIVGEDEWRDFLWNVPVDSTFVQYNQVNFAYAVLCGCTRNLYTHESDIPFDKYTDPGVEVLLTCSAHTQTSYLLDLAYSQSVDVPVEGLRASPHMILNPWYMLFGYGIKGYFIPSLLFVDTAQGSVPQEELYLAVEEIPYGNAWTTAVHKNSRVGKITLDSVLGVHELSCYTVYYDYDDTAVAEVRNRHNCNLKLGYVSAGVCVPWCLYTEEGAAFPIRLILAEPVVDGNVAALPSTIIDVLARSYDTSSATFTLPNGYEVSQERIQITNPEGLYPYGVDTRFEDVYSVASEGYYFETPCVYILGRETGDNTYHPIAPVSLLQGYTEVSETVSWNSKTYSVVDEWKSHEQIGNLTVEFSEDSYLSSGHYFKFPVADHPYFAYSIQDLYVLNSGAVAHVSETFLTANMPTPEGLDEITLPQYNLVYPASSMLVEVSESDFSSVCVPLTSKKVTHKVKVVVTLPSYTAKDVLPVIVLPKVFTQDGVKYLVDCESVVVTDGHRPLPWSLCTGSELSGYIDRSELIDKNWVITVNRDALAELYDTYPENMSDPTAVLLTVYFRAVPVSDVLPLTAQVHTYYTPVRGGVDNHTKLYIEVLDNLTPKSSSLPLSVIVSGVREASVPVDDTVTVHTAELNEVYSSYIKVEGYALPSGEKRWVDFRPYNFESSCWSFEMYFNTNDEERLVSSDHPMFLLDTRKRDNGKLYGLAVALRQGCLEIVYTDGRSTDPAADVGCYTGEDVKIAVPVKANQWKHLVLNCVNSVLTVLVDGVYAGSCTLPRTHTFWAFVLGSRWDTQNGYFNGYIRWVHYSDTVRWLNEFDPPPVTSSWQESDNWEFSVSNRIVKLTLPVSLPPKLKVTDSSGQELEWCLLTSSYTAATDEKYGNLLYVKLPKIEACEGLERVGYIQYPGDIATVNSLVWGSAPVSPLYGFSSELNKLTGVVTALSTYLSQPVYFGTAYEVTRNFVSAPYDYVPVSEPFPLLHKPRTYKLHIEYDETAENSDPQQFFDVYIHYSLSATDIAGFLVGWGNSSDDYTLFDTVHTGDCYLFAKDTVFNTVECMWEEGKLDSTAVSTFRSSAETVSDLKFEVHMNTPYLVSTTESFPTVLKKFSSVGNVLVFQGGKFSALIGYKKAISCTSSYAFLTVGNVHNSLVYQRSVRLPVEGENIEAVDAQNCDHTLHITSEDASREIAVWYVPYNEDLFGKEAYTYFVTDFDAVLNYLAIQDRIFPLVDVTQRVDYRLLFTTFTDASTVLQVDPAYIFTKDDTFISMLKGNAIQVGSVRQGWLPDTEEKIVSADTEYSAAPTDTYLLCMRAVTPRFKSVEHFPLSAHDKPSLGYTVWQSVDVVKQHVTQPDCRFTYLLPLEQVVQYNSVKAPTRMCTQQQGVHTATVSWLEPRFYYGTDAELLARLQNDEFIKASSDSIYDRPLIMHSGKVSHTAAYADVRILPQSNVQVNFLLDKKKHPLTKVKSFGHFSVVGATTAKLLAVVPVIKFHNTVSDEVFYYAPLRHTLEPELITLSSVLEDPQKLARADRAHTYYASVYTFTWADTLLNELSGEASNTEFQYGWLIIAEPSDDPKQVCVTAVRGISVYPVFTDDYVSWRTTIPYCLYIKSLDMYTDSTEYILGQNEILLFYRGETPQTTVVRIDLSDVDLNQFSSGIAVYKGDTPLPSVYEIDDGYLTPSFTQFRDAGGKYIHVKVSLTPSEPLIRLRLQDVNVSYDISDVYDQYTVFGQGLDTSLWNEVQLQSYVFGDISGDVHPAEVGEGASGANFTERAVGGCLEGFVAHPGVQVQEEATVSSVAYSNASDVEVHGMVLRYDYQAGYTYQFGIKSSHSTQVALYLSETVYNTIEIDTLMPEFEVPYYHLPDEQGGYTLLRIPPRATTVRFYVYYEADSDKSSSDVWLEEPVSPFAITHSDVEYEIKQESDGYEVNGVVYTDRLVVDVSVSSPTCAAKIVKIPIVGYTGTKKIVVTRRKTLEEFFTERSTLFFDLQYGIIAQKVELPTPTAKEADPLGDGSEILFYRFAYSADDEHGNYNGVWSGSDSYSLSPWGYAAMFTGSNAITVDIGAQLEVPFTVVGWFYPNKEGEDTQVLFGWDYDGYPSGSEFDFFLISNDKGNTWKLNAGAQGQENYTGVLTVPKEWIFFVATFKADGAQLKMYRKDGLLIGETSSSVSLSKSMSTKFCIGAWLKDINGTGFAHYFNGKIANFRLFNKELTDEEIQRIVDTERILTAQIDDIGVPSSIARAYSCYIGYHKYLNFIAWEIDAQPFGEVFEVFWKGISWNDSSHEYLPSEGWHDYSAYVYNNTEYYLGRYKRFYYTAPTTLVRRHSGTSNSSTYYDFTTVFQSTMFLRDSSYDRSWKGVLRLREYTTSNSDTPILREQTAFVKDSDRIHWFGTIPDDEYMWTTGLVLGSGVTAAIGSGWLHATPTVRAVAGQFHGKFFGVTGAPTVGSYHHWRHVAFKFNRNEYWSILPMPPLNTEFMSRNALHINCWKNESNMIHNYTYTNVSYYSYNSTARTHTGLIHAWIGDTSKPAVYIRRLRTHISDGFFRFPERTGVSFSFTLMSTKSVVGTEPLSMDWTNWTRKKVTQEWNDIKISGVSYKLYLVLSPGREQKVQLLWFRRCEGNPADVIQLTRDDIMIAIPNKHYTWVAFDRNSTYTMDKDAVLDHIQQVKSRNKSIDVPDGIPVLNACEQCRGIAARWTGHFNAPSVPAVMKD